ncbi:MAG: FG-GAP-like repeat-containing protein [Myxococcota bacterium]
MRATRTLRLVSLLLPLLIACGGGEKEPDPTPATGASASAMSAETPAHAPTPEPAADPTAVPDDLPTGLLIGYSPFSADDRGRYVRPAPARLEMLVRRGGEWRVTAITDPDSNVFHKGVFLDDALITIGGMGAFVKRWKPDGDGWAAETLWTEAFGGRIDRMRDVEVGDLYGDGKPALAIATHDQGVVAALRQTDAGWEVNRLDRRENTFVHEIELGDLNGDGTLEVYATPSEPNQVGVEQSGEVVRYVPKDGEGRTVVADLGNRHAKEIWVGDADGDGRDELYVSVEGLTSRDNGQLQIREPVEIRRYDANTPPDAGVVIARIEGDHLMRFLTVGDIDGDGKMEMVAASFSRGLWLLRPGTNPRGEWSKESIDRDSGGFEHTSLLADLDGNGSDELYVASDNDGELRRYVWVNGRARREVIHSRETPRSMITWNLTTAPAAFLAGE